MDAATVALVLFSAFSCAFAASARDAPFGYPADEHVIITQYGPVQYEPVTADQMNRPYDGYYKAEVIPLDMNTWKPVPGGGWSATGPAGVGGGGRGGLDAFDVPLTVGYSVRPAKPLRRRSHDYRSMATAAAGGHRPPPHRHRAPRPAAPSQPVPVEAGLWRF